MASTENIIARLRAKKDMTSVDKEAVNKLTTMFDTINDLKNDITEKDDLILTLGRKIQKLTDEIEGPQRGRFDYD
jgi:peptidoglycan hydrolase CwlO-like protein